MRERARAESRRPARRGRRRGPFSPLTRRILAINLLALAIVVAGMLYLGAYRAELIDAKTEALLTQGDLIAGALGGSVVIDAGDGTQRIDDDAARRMLRRLVVTIGTRARLFDASGALVADSRLLPGTGSQVQAATLPPPAGAVARAAEATYAWVVSFLPPRKRLEPYTEAAEQRADHYPEARAALTGESGFGLRDGGDAGVILSIAVPVQRFKQVQGALMLSTTTADIEDSVREVRYAVLEIFAVALAITVLLSVFLAGTIARPVRRLAEAADAVRHGHGHGIAIPDFSARGDEIGDLSQALREMTDTLSQRMDAIESFAADVAHEIRNPLSSLRSAVEAVAHVKDPQQQRKLLDIARDDVQRLDRLISDIADASRLDAELARAESEPVDLGRLLAALVEVYQATTADALTLTLDLPADESLVVAGLEDRLVQVFQNLVSNARTFSPPGGAIRIAARRGDGWVEVTVADEGPGIAPGKLEAIFERFYCERPATEKFGIHSGLGLSISKQIVEAFGGVIYAENRGAHPERPEGARFVVRLPL